MVSVILCGPASFPCAIVVCASKQAIWSDQDYSLTLTLMNKIMSLTGKGAPQELTQGLKCSTLDPLKVSSSGNGANI